MMGASSGFSCDARRPRAPLTALAVLYAIGLLAPLAEAAQVPSRPGDVIWHVSTRHLGYPTDCAPDVVVHRYEEGWQESSAAAFFATDDPHVLTCIYVNAARVESDDTAVRGFQIYRALARHAPSDRPLRLVIWSWQTPRTRRPLRDFRTTVAQIDWYGYYLGWFLSEMDPDVKVSLVGYSFGASVIAGSVHLLAGGSLGDQQLSGESGPRSVRVVMWSAAMHNYWLLPDRRYGAAMSRIDHLYVLINSCDPVLKRYRFAIRCARPAALGYTGLACPHDMGESLERITQDNACGALGRSHSFAQHVGSSYVMGHTASYLLWEPVSGEADAG